MLKIYPLLFHSFYWICFILLFVFTYITFPYFTLPIVYFILHLFIGLLTIVYSHFILPIYFSKSFSYLCFCMGLSHLFFTTQFIFFYIMSIRDYFSHEQLTTFYLLSLAIFALINLYIVIRAFISQKKDITLKIHKLRVILLYTLLLTMINTDVFSLTTYLIPYNFLFVSLIFVTLFLLLGGFIYLLYHNMTLILSRHFYGEDRYLLLGITLIINLLFHYLFLVYYPNVSNLIHYAVITFVFYLFGMNIHQTPITTTLDDLNSRLLLQQENSLLLEQYLQSVKGEKKQALKSYHSLTEKYEHLLSIYPDSLFVLDLDASIIRTNADGYDLLNMTPDTDLSAYSLLDFLPPPIVKSIPSLITSLMSGQDKRHMLITNIIPVSGQPKEIELTLLLSYELSPQRIIATIRDISYRTYTIELETQIALEKVKVEFFSTLSHELKTPINVIYSAIQLQNHIIKEKDLQQLFPHNQMISVNCLRLLKLVNNLLDLNRIDSDFFHVSPQMINVVTFTEDILSSTEPYATQKNISLLFDTDAEELYCSIDPSMFERILLNLYSNAIKYGKTDGLLTVILSHTSETVRISITDDGMGIPKAAQASIFERFSRAENGLTRTNEGAGIGLSLVKSFIELNQGSIRFESMEHIGTTFTLEFPLVSTTLTEDIRVALSFNSSHSLDLEFSDFSIS